MSWEIRFAYQGRDQPLADALADQRALPVDERPVARALLLELATERGIDTAGDALDLLERATPGQRRRLLDAARQAAGLETTGSIDAEQAHQARVRGLRGLPERDELGRAWQVCAALGCTATPQGATGAPLPVAARRWWCGEHEHLAGEHDLEPWTPRIRYSASGAIEFAGDVEAEAARDAERERSRRAELDSRRAEREVEAEQLRAHERAVREHDVPANLIGATTNRKGNPR